MCAARVSTAVALSTSVQSLLHFDRCQPLPRTDPVGSAGKTEKTLYPWTTQEAAWADRVSKSRARAQFRGWAVSVLSVP